MERTYAAAGAESSIERIGNRQRIRVDDDQRIDGRAGLVVGIYTGEVLAHH